MGPLRTTWLICLLLIKVPNLAFRSWMAKILKEVLGFRGTRHLQQPKPHSTTPLSTSTATHNTNLYGTIAFWGRECLAIQMPLCLLVRLCSKKKFERKKRGKTRRQCDFLKTLSNSKRMNITLDFLCRYLQLPFP